MSRYLLLAALGTSTLGCSGVPIEGDETAPGAALEASDEDIGSISEAFTAVRPGTRRTIQALSAADRTTLANAIVAFITQPILDEHINSTWHHAQSELFFSGHHGYLNKLENYLLANGLSQFVPVPMWNPGTAIPPEFLVLDPLVAGAGALNPNPNMPPPSHLVNVCSEPYATAGDLAIAVESPWHDQVHGAVGGAMSRLSTAPGAPIFWLWHGFLDEMYHTYQACMTPRSDVTATLAPADGSWGSWRNTVYCPPGEYATSFQMRVESSQGSGDDTSLNSVQLQCRAQSGGASWWISSHNGFWGSWGNVASCKNASTSAPTNFLDGARLRVEPSQGSGDDTGANDATFSCRQGDVINPGGGRSIGNWSSDATCPADSAICGISTRVEDRQGSGDDTAMNGIRLKCCRVEPVVAACSSPINESWSTPLTSTSSAWNTAWGDPFIDTANRRARLSLDDVLSRNAAFAGSYYITHKLTLSGGTVFTPYPYTDGVLLPSIRRSGNDMQFGGDRYGSVSWSNSEPAGFAGKFATGLLTARVTSYVQAQNKRMAVKVEAGGATYRSGWTAPFTWPQTNTGIIRFVGENNSSIFSGTDDFVYVGALSGCANLTDGNVDAIYNQ